MSWSLATVAAFAWGPFKYELPNAAQLYGYLMFAHLAIILGYVMGANVRTRGYGFRLSGPFLVRAAVVVSLGFFFATLPLTPGAWISTIRAALADPLLARTLFIQTLGGWRDYLAIAVAPFTTAVIPLAIVFWNRIGLIDRFAAVALVAISVLRAMVSASRHGLFATMIIALASVLVAHYGRVIRIPRWAALAGAGGATVAFLLYANFIALTRVPEGLSPDYSWTLNAEWVDEENPLYRLPPRQIQAAVITGVSYFTHGYRGLSLALALPFRGITFGVGNSMFLTRNAARVFGTGAVNRLSIPSRMVSELGYSPSFWMTEYPWIASDVTFPGSVIVLFFMGYLMASAYREGVVERNPFAVITFTWIVFFMVSLPQGSITQDGSVVVAILCAFVLWRLSRLRPSLRTVSAHGGFARPAVL